MKFRCFQILAGRVDRENGIIYGVSIIQKGAARGHGVLIDDKTLETVRKCAETYKSGLKVKFNPDTFQHGDASIAGVIPVNSFRIEEGVFYGDLHITKSYAGREYLMDLAETQPDTFGLSIDFSGEDDEVDGIKYARCSEIYAVTVVDMPAANATGLFSVLPEERQTEKPSNNTKPMTKEEKEEMFSQFKNIMTEAIKPLSDRLTTVETRFAQNEDDKDPETTGMSAEQVAQERVAAGVVEGDTALTANRKINTYRKARNSQPTLAQIEQVIDRRLSSVAVTQANPPVRPGGNGGSGGNGGVGHVSFVKTFATHRKNGADFKKAFNRAMEDDPKGYEEYAKGIQNRTIEPITADTKID